MCRVKRLVLIAAMSGAVTLLAQVGAASAAPPSNDAFAGAKGIASVPFSTSQDTTQATLDPADAAAGQACGAPGGTFSNSVWFAYTPGSSQQLRLDASASSYSVAGAVLTGTPASFSAVSCFLGGSTSFQADQGTTYYIDLLQSPAGSGGTLSLSLTELVAPNPVLTVARSGHFDSKSGAATVSGTASCGQGASAFVFGSVSQSVGRIATILGFGGPSDPIVCDGTPHPWSFVATPSSGLFKGGKATASVEMSACSLTCDFKQVTRRVQLKH
jgi:hypothetical protein